MTDDFDVARVAAALNAPGLRYRSFNNAPVRVRIAFDAVAPVEELTPVAESPPPAAVMQASAGSAPVLPLEPEPLLLGEQDFEFAPLDPAELQGSALPLAVPPEPASAQLPSIAAAPVTAPPVVAPPDTVASASVEPAPLFAWPDVALPEPPTAAPAMASLASVVAAPAPMPAPQPVPQAASSAAPWPMPAATPPRDSAEYRLLASIGRLPDPPAPAASASAGNTTLAMLRSRIDAAPEAPPIFPGFSPPPPSPPPQPSLLPAGAVTVPLSDVMRLIAAGAPPPASPFEAFRSALAAQPAR